MEGHGSAAFTRMLRRTTFIGHHAVWRQTLAIGVACAALCGACLAELHALSGAVARSGTVSGHVTFSGKEPGNPVIRMGMDPGCAEMTRGQRVAQEQAVVALDGSLANVFVRLDGEFPPTAVPKDPVVIDQRSCVYGPRVVGIQVGQRLVIRNDDSLLHNVHSVSTSSNGFNVGQPVAGAAYEFVPKAPEVMLRLSCDVHRWMTAFVGVVTHPYFAVTDRQGQFSIRNIPPGTYTLKTWHEQFGERSQPVTIRPGIGATLDVTYERASMH